MEKNNLSIAIVDVNAILQTGFHAQATEKHIKEGQAIFQYNLEVIIKKLEAYQDKRQANHYFIQAKNQLDMQFENFKKAVIQSMLLLIRQAIDAKKGDYSIIIPKSNILYTIDNLEITSEILSIYNTLAIVLPQLPIKIDTPNLPAENIFN